MRVLVDTNILLRSAQPSHPVCQQAVRAVSVLMRQNHSLCYCSQNIAEFWNVATRPAGLNGLGLSPRETIQEVSAIERSLGLLPDIPAVYGAWKNIVAEYEVRGVKVYDARIVAIMTVYHVDHLLTFNTADFSRYKNITALHPSSVEI
jgi:predicted nucleic acid-binding protein